MVLETMCDADTFSPFNISANFPCKMTPFVDSTTVEARFHLNPIVLDYVIHFKVSELYNV